MNLDKVISSGVHTPKIGDVPLYTRIDDNYEESKSEKWLKAASRNFNSPNNVRRVFISSDKVLIQFYKPPIRNSKPSTSGNWVEVSIHEDLYETVKKFMGYNEALRRFYMEKAVNPSAVEPEKVRVQGLGLKAFSSPWVVSNIEEVYFDTSMLISEDIRGAIPGAENAFRSWIGGNMSGVTASNMGAEIFFNANGVSEGDFRRRYPRLRTVGIVSNMKSLMGQVDREIRDGVWLTSQSGVHLIKESRAFVIYSDLGKDLGKFNPVFHCRDGIYLFDREVLSDYIEEYKNRAVKVKEEGKSSDSKSVRVKKSEFEEHLDKIQEARGDAYVLKALIIGLNGAEKEAVNLILGEMSSEGEQKYRKILKGE